MRYSSLAAAFILVVLYAAGTVHGQSQPSVVEFAADELEDKIRGGMLAQVIGNLNGLPHEMKYIDEPGRVDKYTPSLPDGAVTDDDTDIEWVYLREIARSRDVLLPSESIAALWKRHINRRIWCANLYARGLMDLGFQPPWTGNAALNPWSDFNISGQFICESFGLMAPGMPQTASRIGLHYTHVTIDGEPAQTTQLFATMVALAFVEEDINRLLDAGLAAVDPKGQIAQIVRETRDICAENANDWRTGREQIKTRWQKHGGEMRDRNGYELNTACTVAALLYGRKDFTETLRIAFNLGWDCDNNAATAATILGVMKGRRWMDEQGWDIADVYRNTSRDKMPMDETLTGFEDTLIECARLVIQQRMKNASEPAGLPRRDEPGGSPPTVYRISTEQPAMIEPLSTVENQTAAAREEFLPRLDAMLRDEKRERAAAAYVAICLGEVERLQRQSPAEWTTALAELQNNETVVRNLFSAKVPEPNRLREAAKQAGLKPPMKKQ